MINPWSTIINHHSPIINHIINPNIPRLKLYNTPGPQDPRHPPRPAALGARPSSAAHGWQCGTAGGGPGHGAMAQLGTVGFLVVAVGEKKHEYLWKVTNE